MKGFKNKTNYIEKCKEFQEKIDWINYCIRKKVAFPYMEALWLHCHADRISTITEDTETNDTMLKCLQEFNWNDCGLKSLVLHGPAGCGKTNWAKIHCKKPALFVTHLDRLKDFDPTYHQSIIFDDLSFSHLPRTSQIHLVDRENPRDIHIRYKIINIPARVQKIFTCNEIPFTRHDEAINRRITYRIIDPINRPFI